jgi:hypothetical protein
VHLATGFLVHFESLREGSHLKSGAGTADGSLFSTTAPWSTHRFWSNRVGGPLEHRLSIHSNS